MRRIDSSVHFSPSPKLKIGNIGNWQHLHIGNIPRSPVPTLMSIGSDGACDYTIRALALYVDEVTCRLNPTYRHSQQRRDNLAGLRKPGLTGLPAQIYDAAQRDALPKEGE